MGLSAFSFSQKQESPHKAGFLICHKTLGISWQVLGGYTGT